MIQENFFREFTAEEAKKYKLNSSFVYFLFYKEKLIYVGETTNLGRRCAQHKANKIFDTVKALLCPNMQTTRRKVEAEMQAKYLPPLQQHHKSFKTARIDDVLITDVKECFRIDGDTIRNAKGEMQGVVSGGYAFVYDVQPDLRDKWKHYSRRGYVFRYLRHNLATGEDTRFDLEIPLGFRYVLRGDQYEADEIVPVLAKCEELLTESEQKGYKKAWVVFQLAKMVREVSETRVCQCAERFGFDRYFIECTFRKAGVKIG